MMDPTVAREMSVEDLVSEAFHLNPDPDEIVKALQELVDGTGDGPLAKIELSRVSDDVLQLAIDSGLVRKIAQSLVTPDKKWASWIGKVHMVVRWVFSACYNKFSAK